MERPHIHDELRPVLEHDEVVAAHARAGAVILAVTDRRLIVTGHSRPALDIPIADVRRIQFDIEKSRPATLVIVPERPEQEPQVLAIPVEEYARAAETLALLGQRLATLSEPTTSN